VQVPLILSIDVGTTSIKAALIETSGRLREMRRTPVVPQGTPAAGLLGRTLAERCFALCRQLARDQQPAVIVISGNGPSVFPVDGDGNDLAYASLWFDQRSVERVDLGVSYYLPRVAYFVEKEPRAAARARWFLPCAEFLTFLLTGEAAAFIPSPRYEPFMWTAESARAVPVAPETLPPFVQTGSEVGRVTSVAGKRSGVAARTPVVAGGADFLMSLLGTATVEPGRVCDRAGTSEGVNYCSRHEVRDDRVRCLPHILEPFHNVARVLACTGRVFEWFRGVSGQDELPYDEIMRRILATPPTGGPRFFPAVGGEGGRWELSSGVFEGIEATHGPGEIGRAVVESIGFAAREAVEILEDAGCPVRELRLCGGQARNSLWSRLKADIVGRPILVPEVVDAELLGNATAGRAFLDGETRLGQVAEQVVRFARREEPHSRRSACFADRYGAYQERYDQLKRQHLAGAGATPE